MRQHHPLLDLLRSVQVFDGLRERELHHLAQLGELAHFRPGVLLMLERYHGEQLHIIVDGEVEVVRDGVRLAVLGPGEVVGEHALLSGTDRNATVRTLTRVRTVVLDQAAFAEVLARYPTVAARIRGDDAHRTAGASAARTVDEGGGSVGGRAP